MFIKSHVRIGQCYTRVQRFTYSEVERLLLAGKQDIFFKPVPEKAYGETTFVSSLFNNLHGIVNGIVVDENNLHSGGILKLFDAGNQGWKVMSLVFAGDNN